MIAPVRGRHDVSTANASREETIPASVAGDGESGRRREPHA